MTFFYGSLVFGSHVFGVLVLFRLRSTGLRIYPGDDFGFYFRIQLFCTTVATCSCQYTEACCGTLDGFHVFCVKVTSDPEVDMPFALLGAECH